MFVVPNDKPINAQTQPKYMNPTSAYSKQKAVRVVVSALVRRIIRYEKLFYRHVTGKVIRILRIAHPFRNQQIKNVHLPKKMKPGSIATSNKSLTVFRWKIVPTYAPIINPYMAWPRSGMAINKCNYFSLDILYKLFCFSYVRPCVRHFFYKLLCYYL